MVCAVQRPGPCGLWWGKNKETKCKKKLNAANFVVSIRVKFTGANVRSGKIGSTKAMQIKKTGGIN